MADKSEKRTIDRRQNSLICFNSSFRRLKSEFFAVNMRNNLPSHEFDMKTCLRIPNFYQIHYPCIQIVPLLRLTILAGS